MPNLGPAELILILAIALIVFGPKKLPEIGKGIGSALREFNKAKTDFMDTLQNEVNLDDTSSPSRSSTYNTSSSTSDTTAETTPALHDGSTPGDRQVEFPTPLDEDAADALPYGGDFQTEQGDSQPVIRTAAQAPVGTVPVSAGVPDTSADVDPTGLNAGSHNGKA